LFHPTRFTIIYVQPRWTNAQFHELRKLSLEIEVLLLPVHCCGTVYRLPSTELGEIRWLLKMYLFWQDT